MRSSGSGYGSGAVSRSPRERKRHSDAIFKSRRAFGRTPCNVVLEWLKCEKGLLLSTSNAESDPARDVASKMQIVWRSSFRRLKCRRRFWAVAAGRGAVFQKSAEGPHAKRCTNAKTRVAADRHWFGTSFAFALNPSLNVSQYAQAYEHHAWRSAAINSARCCRSFLPESNTRAISHDVVSSTSISANQFQLEVLTNDLARFRALLWAGVSSPLCTPFGPTSRSDVSLAGQLQFVASVTSPLPL